MSAMSRTIGRVMSAFALIIGIGFGIFAATGPAQAAGNSPAGLHGTAEQVVLTRTGGFAGVTEQFLVLSSTVHPGTPVLMGLVNSNKFDALDGRYPAPSNVADGFTYEVAVTYSDGYTKRVVTGDGAKAPDVLWRTIRTTLRIAQDVNVTIG